MVSHDKQLDYLEDGSHQQTILLAYIKIPLVKTLNSTSKTRLRISFKSLSNTSSIN